MGSRNRSVLWFALPAEAMNAIRSNASRTILTLLGVVIGISSVITVLAAGAGGKAIIMREFEGLSPTSLAIGPNWESFSANQSFRIDTLTNRDIDDLVRYAPHVTAIAPIVQMRTVIRTGDKAKQMAVTGTTEAYIEYVEFTLNSGRIISSDEVNRQEKVAMIGYGIREEFFPEGDAVGKHIELFGVPVLVVGVLDRKEKANTISLSDPDETFNNAIVVPVTLFKRLFGGNGEYWQVMGKAVSVQEIPRARREIIRVLDRNHGLWDDQYSKFAVTAMKEQIEMMTSIVGTVTLGVAVLAGIALLVAAIGIMNIMLVSVKERTREIGIRQPLPPQESHISAHFRLEPRIRCGGGGLAGLGLSAVAAQVIGALAKWPVIIDPQTAFIAVSLSLFTGLASGYYPAARAAKLVPHEALRYE